MKGKSFLIGLAGLLTINFFGNSINFANNLREIRSLVKEADIIKFEIQALYNLRKESTEEYFYDLINELEQKRTEIYKNSVKESIKAKQSLKKSVIYGYFG